MTKTKKFLSVVLSAILLLGCCSMSSFALELSDITGREALNAGNPVLISTSALKSVESDISDIFTGVAEDAEFIVYYTTENLENYDIITLSLKAENVKTVHAESAYIADGVLHIDLRSSKLSAEGYYHIYIADGSLTTADGKTNYGASTDGAEYRYVSLKLFDKIKLYADYLFSIICNFFSYGETY